VKDDETFSGYNDGYNRTVLANRVRDLLTLLAFAQQNHPPAIHLVAFDRAGVWSLLARALAGPAIQNAAIDLANIDFTQVQTPDDELMLPGALKYGGVLGFAPAFGTVPGATELFRVPTPTAPWLTSDTLPALLGPRVTRAAGAPRPEQMVRWLIEQRGV
jgi:hypothetical protein